MLWNWGTWKGTLLNGHYPVFQCYVLICCDIFQDYNQMCFPEVSGASQALIISSVLKACPEWLNVWHRGKLRISTGHVWCILSQYFIQFKHVCNCVFSSWTNSQKFSFTLIPCTSVPESCLQKSAVTVLLGMFPFTFNMSLGSLNK